MGALRHLAPRVFAQGTPEAIHAHGPGTPEHDPAEVKAYRDTAGPTPFYANKGALGHMLGASGLASLVIACLAARTRQLPPMPWVEKPLAPDISAAPASLPEASTQAVFAAGFAGHVAGAIIRRHA